MIIEYIIIGLVVVLLYAWVLYPFLLSLVARRKTDSSHKEKTDYSVSILVAAHDEEKVIRRRIENLISECICVDPASPPSANCYTETSPRAKILIGSDGSTDLTVSTALEFEMSHDNVKVFEYKERRGKVAVLKNLVRESVSHRDTETTEDENHILVFTDANTEFQEGALGKLLRHFDDPEVGGVCGKLIFLDGKEISHSRRRQRLWRATGGTEITKNQSANQPIDESPDQYMSSSEGVYWRLENWMKERESGIDSCLGANGAIYAVRAECFWEDIPDNTIVDDFVIGMKVREQGKKMVYDPEAVAVEEYPEEKDEWNRRVRIGAGDYQALALCRKCLLPGYGWFAWCFFSHKVLRWFTPHLFILLAVTSFFSTGRQGGYYVMHALVFVAVFALLGKLLKDAKGGLARFFRLCDYFVTMQAALFIGYIHYWKRDLPGMWDRTPRQ